MFHKFNANYVLLNSISLKITEVLVLKGPVARSLGPVRLGGQMGLCRPEGVGSGCGLPSLLASSAVRPRWALRRSQASSWVSP